MNVSRYFDELTTETGAAWNRFWFTPADPTVVSLLRILVGSLACWFFLAFSTDLTVWFGPNGLLPIETAQLVAEENPGGWNGRASHLFLSDHPGWLTATHVFGLAVAGALTVGLLTRVTSVLTLLVVLSYVHRGPLLMGPFEPILTFLLFYLCFAPCQRRWSVDRWWKERYRRPEITASAHSAPEKPSVAANVSQRLIQVHVAALYLLMGLSKLAGEDWWSGEAIWWLLAHTESRLVDLTFLHRFEYLINLWTHAVVVLELSFGVLIWQRLARPLLLGVAGVHWILMGLITGQLSFAAALLVANLSFLSAHRWRSADHGTETPPTPAV